MRLDHLLSKERWPLFARVRPGGVVQSHAQAGRPAHTGWVRVSGVELEGGTLTSSAGRVRLLLVRPWVSSDAGVWNGVGAGGLVVGTLLGPEGTGPPGPPHGGGGGVVVSGGLHALEGFMLVVPLGGSCCGAGGVWRWGMWSDSPYFENCTVDASI